MSQLNLLTGLDITTGRREFLPLLRKLNENFLSVEDDYGISLTYN